MSQVFSSLASMMRLEGRVTVITGAAMGLGASIARMLADQGATVALLDREGDAVEALAATLRDLGYRAQAFQCDVADEVQVNRAIDAVRTDCGLVDVLVNGAGVASSPGQPYTRNDAADFDRTMAVNVKGMFFTAKACHGDIVACGRGRVINLSSITGLISAPFMPAYTVSKAAVISLTKVMARDLAPLGATANAVCPGFIWTPMWESLGRKMASIDGLRQGSDALAVFEGRVRTLVPMQRPQTLADVAAMVAFLASDAAANVTGQAVSVDGGVTI
jgi:NAD(P)-dependent dehydrogenase (short-subunit alcohol dehydrogenase family)